MAEEESLAYPKVFLISPEAAEHLYQFIRLFWQERLGQEMGEAEVAKLLNIYKTAMAKPDVAPIRDTVLSIRRQLKAENVEFSMLELGAANGSVVDVIEKEEGLDGVRYVGIEPWGPFVDDFHARHPGQTMIHAGLDEALELTDEDLGGGNFCVFLASLVFCMVEPSRVRRFIERLSGMCDLLIIQDTIINSQGQLSPDKVAMFPFNPWGVQFYFANPFEVFLNEFGFSVVTGWDMPPKQGKHGWRIFIASKEGSIA